MPQDEAPSALRTRGLAKRFGPVVALHPLDWALPRGETVALLGPNGAGKTTLLRLVAGLTRPSAGAVEVGDAASASERRGRIGLLGHATFLYGALTARENLVLAGRLMGVADTDARAAELLAEHDLERFADRAAGTFSRGMSQRLAIARALVHDPELLLLDEPFTGLDPPSAERLAAQLAAVRAGRRSCVLVTHDLARAASLASRILVLARGRVVHREDRPPSDVAALEATVRDVRDADEATR